MENKDSSSVKMNTPREIISASMIGTIIEWYGIFIFSSGAIYIADVFYPSETPAVALLLTLLTFALGFVTRPIGAFVFGHFGDRIGRKRMLLLTLLISGISTGLTGLIPGFDSIGYLSIAILVILRLILGFGLGGEWGGAMLLTLENFKGKRGFWSSFVQSTVGIGLLIGTGVFLLVEYLLPNSAMISYGWRIPFIASFVIVIIGFLIRYRIDETPIFKAALAEKTISKVPAKELFRKNWLQVLEGTLLAGSSGNFFYFAITLLPTVFEASKVISPTQGLIAVSIFGILDIILVFIGGMLSDRIGRKIPLLAANILALVLLYPSIYITGFVPFTIIVSLFGVAHGLSYSPLGAFVSEVFPTNVRYSGNSMAYQFGNAFIGGPAPYASDLLGGITYFLYPVFTLAFIIVAFGTIATMRETSKVNIGESPSGT
ncbi:MAG: MFS transporter [Thermoplasmataceae archaeon]|jgi:MFS family permease